ncbi:MAG: hypothetical protein RL204_65 [Bacteroidota bacterium]|jgi:hypothetical protein
MKYYFLLLISIVLLYVGCVVRQTPKPAAPPPKIYPEEVNFLRTMAIGDTVFIFIKESGYFQPFHNPYQEVHLTCYTRQELCRIDTFLYKSRQFFYSPGGTSQKGPDFEFDTVKFQLQKALDACNSLEPYCVPRNYRDQYAFPDTCLWRKPGWEGELKEFKWRGYTTLGMSDSRYHEWRYSPPTHAQLKAWRESMFMNDPKPVWKYEVLSFYKDTCKISYSDHLEVKYPYDFSKLK